MTLCQAHGVALSATDTIKNVAARQRPGFFDYVDYAGYSAVAHGGDRSAYDGQTKFGDFGSLSKARAPSFAINDAQRSFPSGHASLSFTGMAFLTAYLRRTFRIRKGVWFTIPAFVAALPLIVSAFIAISRVRDRKHNPDDISVGTAIGLLGSYLAWRNYDALINDRDALREDARRPGDRRRPASDSDYEAEQEDDATGATDQEEEEGGGAGGVSGDAPDVEQGGGGTSTKVSLMVDNQESKDDHRRPITV